MKTVRIYDFETKSITTIPERELSSHMIAAQIGGIEGIVYVDQRKLTRSPVRHEQLPDEQVDRIKSLASTLGEVFLMSFDEWLDNFKRDMHPENELAVWERIAQHYAMQTKPEEPVERRREVAQVLLACSSNPPDVVRQTVTCKHLSRGEVSRICDDWNHP